MSDFKRICKLTDLKEEIGKRFIVDDIEIAVFLYKGKVYAIDNICPHQKSPLLFDGYIEDGYVICPAHGWEFNLENGKRKNNLNGVRTYETKIINDEVYVKVLPKELNWTL